MLLYNMQRADRTEATGGRLQTPIQPLQNLV